MTFQTSNSQKWRGEEYSERDEKVKVKNGERNQKKKLLLIRRRAGNGRVLKEKEKDQERKEQKMMKAQKKKKKVSNSRGRKKEKEKKGEKRKKEWEPDRLLPLILYVGHIKEAIGRASMKSIEKGKAKTQNSPYCTQIYYFSFAYTVSGYVLGFIFTMCTGSSSTSRNSTAWSRSYCCWGPPDWRTFSVQQFRPSFRLRFLLLC